MILDSNDEELCQWIIVTATNQSGTTICDSPTLNWWQFLDVGDDIHFLLTSFTTLTWIFSRCWWQNGQSPTQFLSDIPRLSSQLNLWATTSYEIRYVTTVVHLSLPAMRLNLSSIHGNWRSNILHQEKNPGFATTYLSIFYYPRRKWLSFTNGCNWFWCWIMKIVNLRDLP